MRKQLRAWFLCLLALSVFSQGIAAAGMLTCGLSQTAPVTAEAAYPMSAHPDTAGHHASGGHGAPAGHHASAADPSDTSPGAGSCSACAACCLATALPMTSQVPAALPVVSIEPLGSHRLCVSFLCEGLERPPRTSPA